MHISFVPTYLSLYNTLDINLAVMLTIEAVVCIILKGVCIIFLLPHLHTWEGQNNILDIEIY